MWSKLEEVFEAVGLEYARQGSYDKNATLPESFFMFSNVETPESAFYDDKSNKAIWNWQIYFYTKNAALLYSKLEDFIRIAKEKGFIVLGKGQDVASNEDNYYGRYVRIKYIENYIQEV